MRFSVDIARIAGPIGNLSVLMLMVTWSAVSLGQEVSPTPAIDSEAVGIANRINQNVLHGNLRFLADDLL